MALFGKNPNESSSTDGKKHWADVIKNTGASDLLVWRHPQEDFNTNSTLIVMPGEEALFFKGGVLEAAFDNGTYKLTTENYPFIGSLRGAFTGGISTFSTVVYFVRKSHSMEIKWGTSSPIQTRDKLLGIATELTAHGSYKIQIENPQKLLTKLLGSNISSITQQKLLDDYFAQEFQGMIRECISRVLEKTQTELLGIEARLGEIAETIEPILGEVLENYGLKMIKFSFAQMKIVGNGVRDRYDEIGMEAIAKLRNAQADKSVMKELGDDWVRREAADILRILAGNPGAGGVAAAGAGVGMGVAAGNVFANVADGMFRGMRPQEPPPATPRPAGRFVQKPTSEESIPTPQGDNKDRTAVLQELKEMLDRGLIEQTDYNEKKTEILNRM